MMDEIKQRHRMIEGVRAFFEGRFFPIAYGGLALLFYVLKLPIVGLAVALLCAACVLYFAEDTRPIVPIVFLTVVTLQYKKNLHAYLSVGAICVYCVLVPLVIFTLVYRLHCHRVAWKSRSGLLSVAFLSAAFLLGGVFSKYYNLKNFGYTIALASIAFGTYAFFAFTLKKREDNFLYLARVCAVAVCIVSLEVFEFYLRNYTFGIPMNDAWKRKIILGWSISNMVAEMMVFLLPAVFYLIYKEKHGCWYWLIVIVSFGAVYLTLSRNALLWGVICVATAGIVNCFVGNNKIVNRIIVAIGIVGIIVGLMILLQWKGFSMITAFFSEVKFTDNGRYAVWSKHAQFFRQSPINGIGFFAYRSEIPNGHATFAHNSLLQMAASTGLIGVGLYLLHRLQTIYVVLKKPKAERLFFGGCIALGVCISLLSPIFFLPYFTVYYVVILLFLEKSSEEDT